MAIICNKLEKLIPPPFITVKVQDSRPIVSKWSDLKRSVQYESLAKLLLAEISYLDGYIVRKGTQLRLEKALLLTTQVYKICQRWKKNEFLNQLGAFGNGFGVTGTKIRKKLKRDRLPSQQWGSWIIYNVLRDAALLAKIKLECENATKFWLGLIASAHHWGDSLVITSILSRIWKLSSCILEVLGSKMYPYMFSIHKLLEPTSSSRWPEDSWTPPESIYKWLRDSMKLQFEPANFNRTILNTPSSQMSSDLLWKTFGGTSSDPDDAEKMETSAEWDNSLFFIDTVGENIDNTFMDYGQVDSYEDTGTVIINDIGSKSKKKSKNMKKSAPRKTFRNYWSLFFKNHETKLKSPKGRKQLLARIKKYKLNEEDQLIRKRLLRLKKLGIAERKQGDNTDRDSQTEFDKKFKLFHSFIDKRVKQLKKGG